MKFKVAGKALLTQLTAVSKVISPKSPMDILENFLLKVEDNVLYITGSDQENVMTARMELIENDINGKIAVNSRRLLEVVKEVSNQPLTFYVNESTSEIDLRFLNGHFNFTGVDAREYPELKGFEGEYDEFELPAKLISSGIESTLFAVSTDTIRPIMTGIFWDIKPESITFVSSDTHKLVKYENTSHAPGLETSFILPSKPAGVLKGVLPSEDEAVVKVQRDDKSAVFTFSDYKLVTRLIKGRYPDYRKVFPQNSPYRLTAAREEILNAVRRVALFASKASHLVKFNIQPAEILIAAQDLDFATSAEERMECDYQGNPMTIGFSSEYMVQVLSNLKGEDVVVELSDPARPGIFKPLVEPENVETAMLQMPMQVIE